MQDVTIYCPDCRGKLSLDVADIDEGEVFECELCMAEVEIIQMTPLKYQLFSEE